MSHTVFIQLHVFYVYIFSCLFLGFFCKYFFLPLFSFIPEYLFTIIVNLHVYIFLMLVMFFTVNCFFLTCKHFLSYCLFYFYLVYTYLDTYAYTLIPVPVFTYIPFTMVHVINLMRTTIYSPHIYTCTFLPVNICLPM